MRGKRAKQYRKLMEQYSQTFGFREPYQVIGMIKDTCRFKMELTPALERTVRGKVKPMITQCEIRKLYAQSKEPGMSEAIEVAKTLERRRCGHHPDEYPDPLPTDECLTSVVDPKSSGANKHRYVVASQDEGVRQVLRTVKGTPQIYVNRSVMILEPMPPESAQLRSKEEIQKLRAGLAQRNQSKRKREDGDDDDEAKDTNGDAKEADAEKVGKQAAPQAKKSKKNHGKGVKGANPLAMQKKRPRKDPAMQNKKPKAAASKPEKTGEAAADSKTPRAPKTGAAESQGQETGDADV
ncbi:rRNA-processing protein-like protein [Emericellopsis cladophorae]|uniref:U three protein 23 n=1 Tax=Emericellopsis cladophorae TaxID=2686198 RepID=A0A9P9XZZ4_9HYPO|nr:rRNA-processing protein-like protein [Emericellopsis cladophorae]KAI6781029.1 rRNA-processing protein-like protein [Emericellopsis cladophorae]